MGSYAYLTAGIITARQAELMKNAFWPMLRQGLLYTIPLTLVSFAIGVIIAVLCALFIINKIPVLKQIAGIYIWVFRGTPLLVQLFIMYWGICNQQVGCLYLGTLLKCRCLLRRDDPRGNPFHQ